MQIIIKLVKCHMHDRQALQYIVFLRHFFNHLKTLFNHVSPVKVNFQPLEVVFCYGDPQFQVVENYSYLFNLRANTYKIKYEIGPQSTRLKKDKDV